MTEPRSSRTLLDALESSANEDRGGFVFHLADGERSVSNAELMAYGPAAAALLASRGVRPGDRVGLLGYDRPEWVRWAFATWFAGASLIPLPYSMRIRDADVFAQQLRMLIDAAGCRLVIVEPRFAGAVAQELSLPWDTPVDLSRTVRDRVRVSPDDVAVVQFTSGSTAVPKGAVLTHGGVLACVENLARHIELGKDGAPGVGWLPFFHDNGLFGHVVPAAVMGVTSHILPPERFARNPAGWLRLIGETGASVTSGPPSAWAVAMRTALRRPAGIDMSPLRVGMLSAETIDPTVVDLLVEGGRRFGMPEGAIVGAYGMAEATLAVTIGRPGDGIRLDEVDQDRMADVGAATPVAGGRTKRVASCGVPIPEASIRIDGPDGPVGDRVVGEVRVRTPSLMRGYTGEGVVQPIEDGWLHSGDLGYTVDGELFVTGRIKDVVIVFGRNYAAEDIEWAASRAHGVRPGRVVAFAPANGSADGHVVIAVEPAGTGDVDEVTVNVRQTVLNALGISPAEVIVLPRGGIPLTTSGKLRRAAVRDAYARRELATTGVEGGLA